ncbi:hypothetical protein STENM327S_07775 [Streptomyces tendae]
MIDSYAGSDDAAAAIAGARAGAHVVRTLYGRRLSRIEKGAGDFATAAEWRRRRRLGVSRCRTAR